MCVDRSYLHRKGGTEASRQESDIKRPFTLPRLNVVGRMFASVRQLRQEPETVLVYWATGGWFIPRYPKTRPPSVNIVMLVGTPGGAGLGGGSTVVASSPSYTAPTPT